MRCMVSRVTGLLIAQLLLTSVALGAPVSDAVFSTWKQRFLVEREELLERGWYFLRIANKGAEVELYNRFMDQLDPEDLTPSQWSWIHFNRMLAYSWLEGGREYKSIAVHSLQREVAEPTAEGAVAAAMLANLQANYDRTSDHDERLVRRTLEHPGMDEAIRAGLPLNLNSTIASVGPEALRRLAPEIHAYAAKLRETPPAMALDSDYLYRLFARAMSEQEDGLKAMREHLHALASRAVKAAERGEDPFLTANLDLLRLSEASLATAGSLVGEQAPELEFVWRSSGDQPRRLSDLRGKVVMLDFWATWCGPCVGSFPELRTLVERYEGLPVEIIGVTSPQGLTYDTETRRHTIAESFADEAAQMAEYIREKNITWTIAFTEENVFNPRFGVTGIPHAVIIDPNGVVRHTGADVGRDAGSDAELMDLLLNEFGLSTSRRR